MNGVEEAWVIIIGTVVTGIVLNSWAEAFKARGVAKWQSKGQKPEEKNRL